MFFVNACCFVFLWIYFYWLTTFRPFTHSVFRSSTKINKVIFLVCIFKVEVENTDCDSVSEAFPDSFWVATVIKIIGYKALLRYEGFGMNESRDFWVSLCSNQVHPVGWCATRGKPLIPPKTIEDKYSDWKDFLCKRLTGARTLPSNFSNKIGDSTKSRFHCGLNLEVVDKNRISQVIFKLYFIFYMYIQCNWFGIFCQTLYDNLLIQYNIQKG